MSAKHLSVIYSEQHFSARMRNLMLLICLWFTIVFSTIELNGAAAGDYRTKTTGNWNSTSSWQRFDGTIWVNATAVPSNSDGAINILNNHTITVSSNTTIDQATVDAGGAIIINSGRQLTINSGSGNDFIVNGTITINGTLNNTGNTAMILAGQLILSNGGSHIMGGGATLTVNSGGIFRREDSSMPVNAGYISFNSGAVYQHNLNGQNIPLATWNTGSVCEITGVTTTKPGNLDQSFYTFNWNCPNQTSIENLNGKLEVINGDFNFISTGTGSVRLGHGDNYALNIGGNFNHQGGSLYATSRSQSCSITISGNFSMTGGIFAGTVSTHDKGEGSPAINVLGNFSISSGTFDFNQYTDNSAGKGSTTLNIYGDFTQTGGTLTETATLTGKGELKFTKSGLQFFSRAGGTISNTINFTVNSGSVTDFGSSIISGSGNFNLQSGAEINLGSADGITQTASLGNIQVSGTRTYSTSGYYTYNGSVAQVTGDGLPSVVSKLKVNNNNHVSLTSTVSVSDTLIFTAGNFITQSDTLIVGTSTSVKGNILRTGGHVVGNLKRWIGTSATADILFPVGDTNYYEGLNFSFTVAPTIGGSITASYTATDPGRLGLNLYEGGDSITNVGFGLWSAVTGNGLAGGIFNLDIIASELPSVNDYTSLRLLRRSDSTAPWTLAGTHVPGTGSDSIPVIHRIGMTSYGQYGIGSGSSNPLPVELLYFKANLEGSIVKLNWATASEINNDFFTVERSANGIHFEGIIKVPGADNSNFKLFYETFDLSPQQGYNYYRLKQTDFDGTFAYSEIIKINYIIDLVTGYDIEIVSITPNPFNELLSVTVLAKNEYDVLFQLMDLKGKIVNEDKFHLNSGINQYYFSDLYKISSGCYFLNVLYDGKRVNQKIIKY